MRSLSEKGHMEVSWNGGTPKSSIFNGKFHEINHPFWGSPNLGNHIERTMEKSPRHRLSPLTLVSCPSDGPFLGRKRQSGNFKDQLVHVKTSNNITTYHNYNPEKNMANKKREHSGRSSTWDMTRLWLALSEPTIQSAIAVFVLIPTTSIPSKRNLSEFPRRARGLETSARISRIMTWNQKPRQYLGIAC